MSPDPSFADIAGIGFGSKEAAQNWITNAITHLSVEQFEALA